MDFNLKSIFSLEKVSSSKQNLLIFLTIILFTLICFANGLNGEFVYDDKFLVERHASIKSLSYLFKLFQENAWGVDYPPGNYRPINNVTIALNFAINGLNPYGYHLVNVFIHIINCLLIYWLCNHYTKIKSFSLLSALLFAAHPVHCEAVTAIYGRPEILATLFLLITWCFYLKSDQNNIWYILSLVSYFLSLLSKESGIVLIPVLLLAHLCTEQTWLVKPKILIKPIGYILTTIPYLILRISVTKTLGVPKYGQYFGGAPFLTRLYTMSLGYIKYFQILVWPNKLYTEYDYSVIPNISTINLSVILSLVLILCLIIIGLWQVKRNALVGFAILFFFATTSVVSNIVFPTGMFIAERVIYLASISVCLLGAAAFYWLYQLDWKKLAIILSIVVLSLSAIRTYYRNLDFQNDEIFFSSILKVAPNHAKAYGALGQIYEANKDLNKAEIYFKKAIQAAPFIDSYYSLLGSLYVKENRIDEATSTLKKALELTPNSVAANRALARIYSKKQDYKKALEFLYIAEKNSLSNAELQQEIGVTLYSLGDIDQAIFHLKKALEIDPYYGQALVNLSIIARKQGREQQATELLKQALELDPKNADANNLWGAKLLAQGDLCQAKVYLTKAINSDDTLAEIHNNLGVLYAQMNVYDKAHEHFQLAVKLNPSAKNYAQNLELINEKAQTPAPAINCPD